MASRRTRSRTKSLWESLAAFEPAVPPPPVDRSRPSRVIQPTLARAYQGRHLRERAVPQVSVQKGARPATWRPIKPRAALPTSDIGIVIIDQRINRVRTHGELPSKTRDPLSRIRRTKTGFRYSTPIAADVRRANARKSCSRQTLSPRTAAHQIRKRHPSGTARRAPRLADRAAGLVSSPPAGQRVMRPTWNHRAGRQTACVE